MEMRISHFTIKNEEGIYEPLDEEMVRQAIGGLLPDDDDDLFESMHELCLSNQHEEDVDIFSSGGGLEMDGNIQVESRKTVNNWRSSDETLGNRFSSPMNEHAYVEHPSRTLFVRSINSSVEDSEIWTLFEPFGDIRSLYTACKHRGFVMVSYFDIRAARTAMRALQNKQLRNKKIDIHFSFPKENPSDKDLNQGTLVIFNLDPSISNDYLRELFGKFGEIKEVRETPHKSYHRFIEFFDVRDAEAALKGLNRSVVAGRRVKIEPSHSNAFRNTMDYNVEHPERGILYGSYDKLASSPQLHFSPGHWDQIGRSLGRGSQGPVHFSPITFRQNLHADMKQYSSHHQNYLLEYDTKRSAFHNIPQVFPRPEIREKTFIKESPTFRSVQHNMEHGESQKFGDQSHATSLPFHPHQNNWSSSNLSSLEKPFIYLQHSPDTPFFGPGSFGSVVQARPVMNIAEINTDGQIMDALDKTENQGLGLSLSPHLQSGSLGANLINHDLLQARIQRIDNNFASTDAKSFYQLDLNRIKQGEDNRTTLMIKNIPNKYTVDMLLEVIDRTHHGMYDFVYLPIDFKNNCNVGYAFINMTSPAHIVSIHEALDGRKWERFNSEKVATLAYARIQGTAALVAHFQNSSLMTEDKRCQPILFDPEGRRRIP